jgi:hypothetical protein
MVRVHTIFLFSFLIVLLCARYGGACVQGQREPEMYDYKQGWGTGMGTGAGAGSGGGGGGQGKLWTKLSSCLSM